MFLWNCGGSLALHVCQQGSPASGDPAALLLTLVPLALPTSQLHCRRETSPGTGIHCVSSFPQASTSGSCARVWMFAVMFMSVFHVHLFGYVHLCLHWPECG